MRMRTEPCKGCTERTAVPNCHGTCEKFAAARAEHMEILDAALAESKTECGRYESKRNRPWVKARRKGRF